MLLGEVVDEYFAAVKCLDGFARLPGVVGADVQLNDQTQIDRLLPQRSYARVGEGVEVVFLAPVRMEAGAYDVRLFLDQSRQFGGGLRVFGIK